MKIPQYMEAIYASWLGKLMGIRLGAPVENWSSEQIAQAFGRIEDFVVPYPVFGADDDSNGPLYFTRVFDEVGHFDVTLQDMANTMLNVIPKEHGFFWWGGVGISTEHTMYHHLSQGIPPEKSGLAGLNGVELSEQIGGQIFSDGWAYIAYTDTKKAVEWAAMCASISHDGEGIEGAKFVSAAISIAFEETDIFQVIEKAKTHLKADSQYANLIEDILQFYKSHPDSPDKCLQYIKFRYPYCRYGGICPIIPNSAVMLMALCYGKNNFKDTLLICVNAGFDTDCNAGNVGSIMGALVSLEGLYKPWIQEINDTAIASGLLGSVNMTDVMTQSLRFSKMASRLNRLKDHPVLHQTKSTFNFALPYSTQGFLMHKESTIEATLRNIEDSKASCGRALQINIHQRFPQKTFQLIKHTYFRATQIYDARYEPALAPIVWPNQWIRAKMTSQNEDDYEACIMAVDILGNKKRSSWCLLNKDYQEIKMQIPSDFHYVHYIGVEFKCLQRGFLSFITIDEMSVDGEILAEFDFTNMPLEDYGLTFDGGRHQEIAGCSHVEGDWMITKSGCMCDFEQVGHLLWGDIDFSFKWLEIALQDWGIGSEVHLFKQGAKNYMAIQRQKNSELMVYYRSDEIKWQKAFSFDLVNWDNILLRIDCSHTIIKIVINGHTFSLSQFLDLKTGCLGLYKPQQSTLTLNQIKISAY